MSRLIAAPSHWRINVGLVTRVVALLIVFALTCAIARAQDSLTNGSNHFGTIATAGEIDTWTFTASAGDSITLFVGKVNPAEDLYAWIRLLAPNGSLIGSSAGLLAAQINNVAVSQTGTYRVLVSAVSNFPNGTGAYMLTLAQIPAPLTISPGDEGGPLTNGANHQGVITHGDLDAWTFVASAGDRLNVYIGKVEPSDGFDPWIRLFGPAGALLGSSSGTLAAQINDVVASQTGTYTVLVGPAANFPYGTGGYTLTLGRVPAGFVQSQGDEGGPIPIGVGQQGEIFRGDLDMWTFRAAPGDSIAIAIGEVAPATSDFVPWIRLVGPTGTLLRSASGSIAAQISVTAPALGIYTVLVASASNFPYGAGHYQLTVTGVAIPNPLSDIALDFGEDYGLWIRYNQGAAAPLAPSWRQLHALSPSVIATGRIDANAVDDLVVTLPGYGVWIWLNNTSWVPVHPFDASNILTADLDGDGLDEIVLNFPGLGIWIYHYANGAWVQLHTQNASRMTAGYIDDGPREDLIVSFSGFGVWQYMNGSTWISLHAVNPNDIQVADLDGNGTDDVVLSLPGYGLWVRFNNATWYQLHALQSAGLAAGNLDGDPGHKQDLIINFDGLGLWMYVNNSTWVRLHSLNAPIVVTGDVDGNGTDDAIISIPDHGVWVLMNGTSWVSLHGVNPQAIAIGRFDGF